MIKSKIKKASSSFSVIISIIIGIVALWLIIAMIINIFDVSEENARVSKCITTIEAHASFVEQNILIDEKSEELGGGISYFFPRVETDPPEIECDSKLIKSKSKTAKKAEKELLTSALKTWRMFRQGKSLFYPSLNTYSMCFVTDVYEFNKDFDFDFLEASKENQINKLDKFYSNDETIYKYFSESINEDLSTIYSTFNPKNNFFGFNMIYYSGELGDEVYDEESWLNRHWDIVKDFYYTTEDAASKKSLDQISINYDFFNMITEESVPIKFEKYDNPHNLYAVVFYQQPVIPEDYWFNIDKINRPFLLSAIMIVPYTESVLKDIGCAYLPAKFEDE
jgi:hypothetical protein